MEINWYGLIWFIRGIIIFLIIAYCKYVWNNNDQQIKFKMIPQLSRKFEIMAIRGLGLYLFY